MTIEIGQNIVKFTGWKMLCEEVKGVHSAIEFHMPLNKQPRAFKLCWMGHTGKQLILRTHALDG